MVARHQVQVLLLAAVHPAAFHPAVAQQVVVRRVAVRVQVEERRVELAALY